MRRKMILIGPLAILAIAAFTFVGGWVVQHLWNWLLPSLFGWRLVTFWEALGLLLLCRILFGNWGGRGGHRSNFRRRMCPYCRLPATSRKSNSMVFPSGEVFATIRGRLPASQ